jgi:hypothetical protein
VVCQAHDSYNEMGHKFCAGFRDNLYVVTVTAQPCRAQIDISIARYPRFNVQGDNGPASLAEFSPSHCWNAVQLGRLAPAMVQ